MGVTSRGSGGGSTIGARGTFWKISGHIGRRSLESGVVRSGAPEATLAGVPCVSALPVRRVGPTRGSAPGRAGPAGPLGVHERNRSGRVGRSVSGQSSREIHHGKAHRSEESCGKQQRFHGVFLLDSQQSKLQPRPGQWDLGPMTTCSVASGGAWLDVADGRSGSNPRARRTTPAVWYTSPGASDASYQPGGPLEERGARVFDRYYIVSPDARQDVARRLTGTIWGTAVRRGGDVSRNFTTSLTGCQ